MAELVSLDPNFQRSVLSAASGASQPALNNENYHGINVDRGVHIRFTDLGVAVYMYPDQPGYWFNDHGKQIPWTAARAAGYDTDRLLAMRRRNDAKQAAGQAIDAQFAELLGKAVREVIEQGGDYQVVHVGGERYNIEFVEDNAVVNDRGPVSRQVALDTMHMLAGDLEPAEDGGPTGSGEAPPGANPADAGRKGR